VVNQTWSAGQHTDVMMGVREKLKLLAYAPSTVKTHQDQLATFHKFVAKLDGIVEPWTEMACVMWVMDALERGNMKNTLTAKINAFIWGSAVLQNKNYPSDGPVDTLYLLRRVAARRGVDAKPKLAIGGHLLLKIRQKLQDTAEPMLATQAMAWFLLAYAGMLRASESAYIEWQHVQFSDPTKGAGGIPQYMLVTLQVTPDHVFKNHNNSIELRFKRAQNPLLCPIMHMWKWMESSVDARNALPQKVFSFSKDSARKLLKDTAAMVSRNPAADYGLHSLRAGGATDADQQGKTLGEIMVMGRWRSAVVLQYIRSVDEVAKELKKAQPRGHASRSAFDSNIF
jgi:hypothetical protein